MTNTDKLARDKGALMDLHRNNAQGVYIDRYDERVTDLRESIKKQEAEILANKNNAND